MKPGRKHSTFGLHRHVAGAICLTVAVGSFSGSAHAQSPLETTEFPPSSQMSQTPKDDPLGPDAAGQMSDIHDIKPLELLGPDAMVLLYILMAIVVAGLFVTALILWKRRRRRDGGDLEPIQSPDELALADLNDLAERKLSDGRIFYFRLSAILRGYIEARHGINALEMTMEQLLPQIESLGVDPESRRELRDLIHSTEPVKFAGSPADGGKMVRDLEFVRKYVQLTTPAEPPVGDTCARRHRPEERPV